MKIKMETLLEKISRFTNTDSHGLEAFIERDPTSENVQLRLKPDTVEDVPANFDVDAVIRQRMDERDNTLKPQEADTFTSKIQVLAEGDSWFKLPKRFFANTPIAMQLEARGEFDVHNIASWGDALQQILVNKEYLKGINNFHVLLLSGGGNDLRLGLKSYIHNYSPSRPYNNYLTPAGIRAVQNIVANYRQIITEVRQRAPYIKIVLHGYAYFQPQPYDVDDPFNPMAQYLGGQLSYKGFPAHAMAPVMKALVDYLNTQLSTLKGGNVTLLDCRQIVGKNEWDDDIHPDLRGFTKLTDHFTKHIRAITAHHFAEAEA